MKKIRNARLLGPLVIYIMLFSVLVYRMFMLQIINADKYTEKSQLETTKTIKNIGKRGNIYDCNGKLLAHDELIYTITMIDNGKYSSERERQLILNSMIYHVTRKLNENKEKVNNELKIKPGEHGAYEFTVTGESLIRFKADIFGEANPDNMTKEQKNMSANEMIEFMSGNDKFALFGEGSDVYSKEELERYGLPMEYSQEEILTIVGIRYMLFLHAYQKYVPVTLARNVSEKTVAYIKENSPELPGIDIGNEWKRIYDGGEAFSHILGYTGQISEEELEKYEDSDKKYSADSVVGKVGIEQYLETDLQGIDGEKEIQVDSVGKIISEEKILREAKCGKDVYLSIDKRLQIDVYKILEQNLAGILTSNLINAKKFDKTHISDSSEIRITIYDVYIALVDNNIIKLDDVSGTKGDRLETYIAKLKKKKYKEIMDKLRKEIWNRDINYTELSEELQEYISFIVNESGILDEDAINKEDTFYVSWKNGNKISLRSFLGHAIESGWITAEYIQTKQQYTTTNELYQVLIDSVEKSLNDNTEFDKLLYKYLILDDRISGRDICKLLHKQGLLDSDSDYKNMLAGKMSTFAFMKKQIEQLKITPAQLALDPCSASAVVVQEKSGKILACVSYPGYDNNRLANQMDTQYYSQLLNDKSLPLYNRATQQLTAPGSTYKPITIIAGLQEGVISPETSITCDGIFDRLMPNLKCWKHSGHGNVLNAATAIQFSCNDYLCEMSYRLGKTNDNKYKDSMALDRLQKYTSLFHLDEKSGIEIVESEPHITDTYGIPSAIGQGTHNYATVQLARYVNGIASKGKVYSLSLIKGVTDTKGKMIKKKKVQKDNVKLPDVVWNTVQLGMTKFAQNNAVLKDMKISIAGKTGTAQESANRPDHSLFVGYAPTEKPEITIAVRIANGYGSSNATAVGRDIFNGYFGTEDRKKIITGKASQVFNTSTD